MNRFKNILFVVEEAVDETSAMERAVSLAESNRSRLTVLEVIPPQDDRTIHAKAVEILIAPYRDRLGIRYDVLTGTSFLEVIRVVLRNGHDLVMKPAENPDFLKRLFGSDDMHLLRKCPCPVWIMKPPEKRRYSRILAAFDFNPLDPSPLEDGLNREILEIACTVALADSAALHLVHAWEAYAESLLISRGDTSAETVAAHVQNQYSLHQKGLYSLGEWLRNRFGPDAHDRLSLRYHLPKGPAKVWIPSVASGLEADLVVMGTVARTGISGLIIGNTAEAILEQLNCSVLAVKPPGFATPVTIEG